MIEKKENNLQSIRCVSFLLINTFSIIGLKSIINFQSLVEIC